MGETPDLLAHLDDDSSDDGHTCEETERQLGAARARVTELEALIR